MTKNEQKEFDKFVSEMGFDETRAKLNEELRKKAEELNNKLNQEDN